jgi:adenylate kinase
MYSLVSKCSPFSSRATQRIIFVARSNAKRCPAIRKHSYLSTMAASSPDESNHFALILGKPGGGKGTISKKILKDFSQFHHVSTGDLLRAHVREGTKLGKEAKQYMDEGKLVPDKLMIDLVMEEATPSLEEGKSLLLDGFPRTVVQAEGLEEAVHVDLVINLDIPTDTIVERIADRWIHPASGRVYSYSYKPPKKHGLDDDTGEKLIQRPDDQPAKVRARLDLYDEVS